MRLSPRSPRFYGCLATIFCLIAFANVASAQTTTFMGTVYSPLGAPPTGTGDPIPNILVFVVAPGYPPPVFTQGLTAPTGNQTGCEAQPNLVPALVLGQALTDAAGHFMFTTTGALPPTVTVVIQAGKWRQQYNYTNIVAGETTPPLLLSMPAAQGPLADLPHIAVVTGASDSIECIFQQIGIASSEITDPSGSGSINFYTGATGPGQYISSSTPTESQLVAVPSTLDTYDVVIFGCQGSSKEADATVTNLQNMESYTNSGGRMFATHYGYLWLDNAAIPDFQNTAEWDLGAYSAPSNTADYAATIDTSYPEGVILDAWMTNIGALYNNTPHTIALQEIRVDTSKVNGPPPAGAAQSWVTLNAFSTQVGISKTPTYAGTPSMQFTFDTPVGASGTPTATIAYTNVTTTFMQGDAFDTVNIVVTNNSTTATTAGLTLTIALPGGVTPLFLAGISPTGWTCNQTTLICTNTSIAAGATDSVALTFSIASTAQVGQATLSAALSGGGLSTSGQCGRVLYNDYHVEQESAHALYPKECTTGLTTQEKFLEFSLYNLSNFVAPTTTDLIDIQGLTTLAWPQPAFIEYGTQLSSIQLDATATDIASNTTIPGTFVYTPVAGTTPAVGNDNLSVAFTPTVAADYTTATANALLEVTPDTTATTLTNVVTPIYYGQIIADAAIEEATSTGPASPVDGGTIGFYIDGVKACTLTANAGGVCPPPTGIGYNAGPHTVQSIYSGDTNFVTSSSPIYTVNVASDATATALAVTPNPAVPTETITLTATVTDTTVFPQPADTTPPAPTGTVSFYDGTTPVGSQTILNGSVATLTLPNLFVGRHNITACFAAGVNSLGNYNFTPACSPAVAEVVTLPPTITPTTALLSSSENPSTVGQSVTFTATIATTGAFIGVPTGTVTFFDGSNSIGTAILDTSGNGTLTTSTLTAGLHNITAVYAGNSSTAASTSPVVAQLVNTSLISAGTGFILTVTPTTFSVGAGSSVALSVEVTELNNFNTPVNLSCSGLPSEATCTFALSTIPATGGTAILLVSPAAPHNCGSNTPYFVAQSGRTGFPIFAAITLIFFARKRRAFKGLVLAALICLIPAISGCGGNCTDLGVKPGTYTFTVTGTSVPGNTVTTGSSTPVTHSQTMTMTVTI
jgi:hypothetical protein